MCTTTQEINLKNETPGHDSATSDVVEWGFDPEKLAVIPTVYRHDLFAGKSMLISGGGSGMGLATAMLVVRLGGNVMICGRNEQKLAKAADDIQRLTGREIAFKSLTIRDPDQVDGLMDEAFDRFGTLDTLVNSAGGQFAQHALDFTVKGWNAVVDTNLNGTWWMVQAAGRRWRNLGKPGSVISIVATIDRGSPQYAHSAAARAGIIHLSKSLAVEWAPLNIRVNCIAPGNIEIDGRFDKYDPQYKARFTQGNPMRRAGNAWDMAQAVAYLAGPTGDFITGEVLNVNGGMHLWGTNWPLGVPEHFKVG